MSTSFRLHRFVFSASSLENTCHKDKIKEISNLIRIPGLMKNSKKTQNRMSVWYI